MCGNRNETGEFKAWRLQVQSSFSPFFPQWGGGDRWLTKSWNDTIDHTNDRFENSYFLKIVKEVSNRWTNNISQKLKAIFSFYKCSYGNKIYGYPKNGQIQR